MPLKPSTENSSTTQWIIDNIFTPISKQFKALEETFDAALKEAYPTSFDTLSFHEKFALFFGKTLSISNSCDWVILFYLLYPATKILYHRATRNLDLETEIVDTLKTVDKKVYQLYVSMLYSPDFRQYMKDSKIISDAWQQYVLENFGAGAQQELDHRGKIDFAYLSLCMQAEILLRDVRDLPRVEKDSPFLSGAIKKLNELVNDPVYYLAVRDQHFDLRKPFVFHDPDIEEKFKIAADLARATPKWDRIDLSSLFPNERMLEELHGSAAILNSAANKYTLAVAFWERQEAKLAYRYMMGSLMDCLVAYFLMADEQQHSIASNASISTTIISSFRVPNPRDSQSESRQASSFLGIVNYLSGTINDHLPTGKKKSLEDWAVIEGLAYKMASAELSRIMGPQKTPLAKKPSLLLPSQSLIGSADKRTEQERQRRP